jgi:hypothetical protein
MKPSRPASSGLFAALALLASFALVTLAAPALAHDFLPSLLEVHEREDGLYQVLWKPASSRAEIAAAPSPVFPTFPPRCVRLDSPFSPEVISPWLLDCGPGGLAGDSVGVDGLSRGADVVLRFTSKRGAVLTAVLREDAPRVVLPDPSAPSGPRFATRVALARTYLGAGLEHILGGFDHLLFVLGLLLLVTRGQAALPPERRRLGHELLRTVTAFTLAHSVTLGLSVLGLVSLPPAPVEATIALSLYFLAIELSRGGSPAPRRRARDIAFVFGLLHGFGFAGALRSLGLPEGQIPLALLCFNLGVELGQLAFVLVALACLHLARRPLARAPASLARVPAYLLGSLAALWCFERVAAFWS